MPMLHASFNLNKIESFKSMKPNYEIIVINKQSGANGWTKFIHFYKMSLLLMHQL